MQYPASYRPLCKHQPQECTRSTTNPGDTQLSCNVHSRLGLSHTATERPAATHNQKGKWTTECNKAFQEAKEDCHHKSLSYDPALPLTLAGDASAYGIGAVISHAMPVSTECPIAFVCRSLSPSECNYAQLGKEALSLILGVKKFHQYLYGRKLHLLWTHKHLTAVLGTMRRAYHHLQLLDCSIGLYFFLSAYQYEIQSSYADGLSHLPLSDRKESSVMSQVFSTLSNSQ